MKEETKLRRRWIKLSKAKLIEKLLQARDEGMEAAYDAEERCENLENRLGI